jgi:hypothetical protein
MFGVAGDAQDSAFGYVVVNHDEQSILAAFKVCIRI